MLKVHKGRVRKPRDNLIAGISSSNVGGEHGTLIACVASVTTALKSQIVPVRARPGGLSQEPCTGRAPSLFRVH